MLSYIRDQYLLLQTLRRVLHDYIVNDIKSLRTSSQAHKLDKELKARGVLLVYYTYLYRFELELCEQEIYIYISFPLFFLESISIYFIWSRIHVVDRGLINWVVMMSCTLVGFIVDCCGTGCPLNLLIAHYRHTYTACFRKAVEGQKSQH